MITYWVCFYFCLHHAACGILVSWPGVEPVSLKQNWKRACIFVFCLLMCSKYLRQCLAHSNAPEMAMASHSSTLAWKIPWTEEPGGLQSMGSLRIRHDWATSLSLFTFMHWRRKWQPTPVFLPGESQGQGSLASCRLWVSQSQTRLKRLSSNNSSRNRLKKLISILVNIN